MLIFFIVLPTAFVLSGCCRSRDPDKLPVGQNAEPAQSVVPPQESAPRQGAVLPGGWRNYAPGNPNMPLHGIETFAKTNAEGKVVEIELKGKVVKLGMSYDEVLRLLGTPEHTGTSNTALFGKCKTARYSIFVNADCCSEWFFFKDEDAGKLTTIWIMGGF